MVYDIENFTALKEVTEILTEFLLDLGFSEEKAFDSKLAVAELCGNVLRHARERASLEWTVEEENIRFTVRSRNKYRPPDVSVCADVFSEGGRGLFLVDSVCVSREYTKDGGISVLIAKKENV